MMATTNHSILKTFRKHTAGEPSRVSEDVTLARSGLNSDESFA